MAYKTDVSPLGIFTYYNKQRFTQMGCMDCANWYSVAVPDTKKGQALYPAMGRKHINSFNQNKLVFNAEPSQLFKTINFAYIIVGTNVVQIDNNYNEIIIGSVPLASQNWFAFFPVDNVVYALLTAWVPGATTATMYLITEGIGPSVTFQQVADPNAPKIPLFVAAFGNSFVVSNANTPNYYVSAINLGPTPNDPNTIFTENGGPIFNRASGIIRQICVLHNQMYIFSDFTTDIWANIPSQNPLNTNTPTFPFKLNSSYNWDYGIADPFSLDVDFGRMCWLGKNSAGLVSFMTSNGQQPIDISTQAINVLIQNSTGDLDKPSSFVTGPTDGFLYQYENSIFYRVSAGPYQDYHQLDIQNELEPADSLEFNFTTQTWARVIELNGERSRVQKHVFFNNMHLVTVYGDTAIYEMAGNIYRNEIRNPAQLDATADDAFVKFPMRYELITPQIFQEDYSEFITDYVEIDFVFGDKTFYENNTAFGNTIFIITEDAATHPVPGPEPGSFDANIYTITEDAEPTNNEPVYIIIERGNTPGFDDNFYNSLFKPNISLYLSDDGGVTFESVDCREFSRLGQYRWRMRWYQLGSSRNRAYKLVCVSSAPIVVLGATQATRRASGGAN